MRTRSLRRNGGYLPVSLYIGLQHVPSGPDEYSTYALYRLSPDDDIASNGDFSGRSSHHDPSDRTASAVSALASAARMVSSQQQQYRGFETSIMDSRMPTQGYGNAAAAGYPARRYCACADPLTRVPAAPLYSTFMPPLYPMRILTLRHRCCFRGYYPDARSWGGGGSAPMQQGNGSYPYMKTAGADTHQPGAVPSSGAGSGQQSVGCAPLPLLSFCGIISRCVCAAGTHCSIKSSHCPRLYRMHFAGTVVGATTIPCRTAKCRECRCNNSPWPKCSRCSSSR